MLCIAREAADVPAAILSSAHPGARKLWIQCTVHSMMVSGGKRWKVKHQVYERKTK